MYNSVPRKFILSLLKKSHFPNKLANLILSKTFLLKYIGFCRLKGTVALKYGSPNYISYMNTFCKNSYVTIFGFAISLPQIRDSSPLSLFLCPKLRSFPFSLNSLPGLLQYRYQTRYLSIAETHYLCVEDVFVEGTTHR